MGTNRNSDQSDPDERTPTGHFKTSIDLAIKRARLSSTEVWKRSNQVAEQLGLPTTRRSTYFSRLSTDAFSCPDWDFIRPIILVLLEAAEDPGSPAHNRLGTEGQWRAFHYAAELGKFGDSPVDYGMPLPRQVPSAAAKLQRIDAEKARASILAGSGVMDTLRRLYPRYDFVRLWGVDYPISVFPAPEAEHSIWEAALAGKPGESDRLPSTSFYSDEWNPDPRVRARFDGLNKRYDANVGIDRRMFFSGSTYTFQRLWFDDGGAPRLDCALGRYFASTATSEDLDAELMSALNHDPGRLVPLSELPGRSWLHRSVHAREAADNPVINGSTRAAALSHATAVFVARDHGRYDLWLPFRSEDVATHAYFNHVAPSGILSPHYEEPFPPLRECSVERNFFREWVEELYAQDAFERPEGIDAPDPEAAPEVIRLKEALHQKRAGLYYTGISVNLLTLRPEICLALVIHDPTWLDEELTTARQFGRPMRLGWEYGTRQQVRQLSHTQNTDDMRVSIEAPSFQPPDYQRFDRGFLVPNAAAAIHLALAMIKKWPTSTTVGDRP
ncbi:hypothetical protein [Nocardia amamiensis]|uniref:hypothetical protein n=1 Tax=Nocardia amamiensis TaxID=404578 RepID=UPI0033F5150A